MTTTTVQFEKGIGSFTNRSISSIWKKFANTIFRGIREIYIKYFILFNCPRIFSIFHPITLKGVSRFASQYRCSRDKGKTGNIVTLYLTNFIRVNNIIIS